MEYVGQLNIKKMCNFYVSDLHLSVVLLPYLSKQIDEDVEITTIFEKNEKKNIELVLDKLNAKNKKEIMNINWFNSSDNNCSDIEKTIDSGIKNNKNISIIIGGSKEYIMQNNEKIYTHLKQICINNTVHNLKEYSKNTMEEKNNQLNVKIINCFDVEDVKDEMNDIVKQYDAVLNTSGELKMGID